MNFNNAVIVQIRKVSNNQTIDDAQKVKYISLLVDLTAKCEHISPFTPAMVSALKLAVNTLTEGGYDALLASENGGRETLLNNLDTFIRIPY